MGEFRGHRCGLSLAAVLCCACALLIADAACAQAPDDKKSVVWGPPVDGQAVSISTDSSAFAPGEPIVLRLRLKNVSNDDLRYATRYVLDQWRLSVSLPDGKPAPNTLYGKERFARPHSSGESGSVLKPGQIKSVNVELTRLFDFSLEGDYTVSVERPVFVFKDGKVNGPATAVSNKLKIAVSRFVTLPAQTTTSTAFAESENAMVTLSIPRKCKLGQAAPLSIEIWNQHAVPFFRDEVVGLPNSRMEMRLIDRDADAAIDMTAFGKAVFKSSKQGDVPPTELGEGAVAKSTIDLSKFFSLKRGSFKLCATFLLRKAVQPGEREKFIKIVVDDLPFGVSE